MSLGLGMKNSFLALHGYPRFFCVSKALLPQVIHVPPPPIQISLLRKKRKTQKKSKVFPLILKRHSRNSYFIGRNEGCFTETALGCAVMLVWQMPTTLVVVWILLQVGGVQIPTGVDCEPLLLHILHLETSGDGQSCEQLVEAPHIFPANAAVSTVLTALALPEGVIFTHSAWSAGEASWTPISQEDMQRTFREHGLKDGSSVLVQDSYSGDNR